MREKSIAGAVVAMLSATGNLIAADLPTPSPSAPPETLYNWTGFYLGINGGFGSGNSNWTDAPVGATGSFPTSGFLVGGTVGANYQVGRYVFGVEGDGDWTNLQGSSDATCGAIAAVAPPSVACQTQSEWLATVRGRVGYAFGRALVYATGGAAFGNIQAGLNPPSTFDSTTRAGWTVGAGFEYAFAQNWTAKAEYLFVELPNGSCATVANCAGAAGSSVSFNESIVRAGINFKFGPW